MTNGAPWPDDQSRAYEAGGVSGQVEKPCVATGTAAHPRTMRMIDDRLRRGMRKAGLDRPASVFRPSCPRYFTTSTGTTPCIEALPTRLEYGSVLRMLSLAKLSRLSAATLPTDLFA